MDTCIPRRRARARRRVGVLGLGVSPADGPTVQASAGGMTADAVVTSGQIVIAGHTAAVERACDIAKAKGAKIGRAHV